MLVVAESGTFRKGMIILNFMSPLLTFEQHKFVVLLNQEKTDLFQQLSYYGTQFSSIQLNEFNSLSYIQLK
jgi:hypothetical protein